MDKKNKKGFTLIELLVVIAIIGILGSLVLSSLSVARRKGLNARVLQDQYQLRTAIVRFEGDIAQLPGHMNSTICTENVAAVLLNNSGSVGLTQDDTAGTPYPGWLGPYATSIPNDPWGTAYRLDKWKTCNGQQGCEGTPNGTVTRAIVSFGPDKTEAAPNDIDNIYMILCR